MSEYFESYLTVGAFAALGAVLMFGLVEMLVFIAIPVLGLVYAIRKGVLAWE